jgi:hypothetical protein
MWGVQKGEDPQRSDLWQADFSVAIDGLNDIASPDPPLQKMPRYYPCLVALPALRVRAEPVRRDSRSYNMPSWDDPLEAIRINFIMDDGSNSLVRYREDQPQSELYRILDVWRSLVRAGRGAVSQENEIFLRYDFALPILSYNIFLYFCRGSSWPPPSSVNNPTIVMPSSRTAQQQATFENTMTADDLKTKAVASDQSRQAFEDFPPGLDVSNVFVLEEAWLSEFKIGELSYVDSKPLTVEALFYAENIVQTSGKAWIPTRPSTEIQRPGFPAGIVPV